MHTDTPTALMPKLIAAADLPHTRLHDLRHLHATTLLLAGVPVHVVAARLGHAEDERMVLRDGPERAQEREACRDRAEVGESAAPGEVELLH